MTSFRETNNPSVISIQIESTLKKKKKYDMNQFKYRVEWSQSESITSINMEWILGW